MRKPSSQPARFSLPRMEPLCAFHLLREYRRNIGTVGYAAARRLLNMGSLAEGVE